MTSPDTAPPAGIQDAARHLAEGRADEAAALLERLARDFPAYVTAHVLLAKAREAGGRPDRALDAWHTAYFLMPGSPLVIRERARLLRTDAPQPETAHPHPAESDPQAETIHPSEGMADPQAETDDPQPGMAHPHGNVDDAHEETTYPHEHVDDPPSETADLQPEATATDEETAEALGAEPDAWTTDDTPKASPGSSDTREEDDWTILDETETARPDDDGVTEPAVAPPPGHPPPHRPAHDQAGTEPLPEDAEEADDLDTLIEQLERAPRIRPDPELHVDEPDPEAFGAGEVVSETLARIYETQKQFGEAARAYEQLAAQRPDRAPELMGKAEEMRRRAAEAGKS